MRQTVTRSLLPPASQEQTLSLASNAAFVDTVIRSKDARVLYTRNAENIGINENFNRVICEQLVQELDPFGDEKTMIFCATDLHADMVKRLQHAATNDENVFTVLMDAVKVCSLGQITDALFDAGGQYRRNM